MFPPLATAGMTVVFPATFLLSPRKNFASPSPSSPFSSLLPLLSDSTRCGRFMTSYPSHSLSHSLLLSVLTAVLTSLGRSARPSRQASVCYLLNYLLFCSFVFWLFRLGSRKLQFSWCLAPSVSLPCSSLFIISASPTLRFHIIFLPFALTLPRLCST